MNNYNIRAILIITLIFVAMGAVVYVVLPNIFTHWSLHLVFLVVFIVTALLVYEKIMTARIRQSLQRFLNQIKQGNYESRKSSVIKKYDFVSLADIQVELSEMVGEIRKDSNEQKKYIENVSHELMTPISVIRGKLELLLQSPNIAKGDFKLISQILLQLERLTKVNQSLVLLSKLDNNHYKETEVVNLTDIVEDTLSLFEDQIRIDRLTIRKNVQSDFSVSINETLAYVLIKNIIKNAIIHNIDQGTITIYSNAQELKITNSGKNIHISTDALFERFTVIEESTDSIGLGLSIIKKICEHNDLQLSYQHKEGIHRVQLSKD